MKTELRFVLMMFVAIVLATTAEAFIDTGPAATGDPATMESHRSNRDYAGPCLECRSATYELDYYCRPGFQCVAFDPGQIDGFESTPRWAMPRLLPTSDRRTECVSANS